MTKAKFAYFFFLLLPALAPAQSTIAGVVRDASGAVVANATVEASSEVLIERSRTVTTNAEGRYAIVDLRPGTYAVTVSQAGFNAVKQTVVVPANVTVPVDAELRVGSVGETVNVEARVATVDVENISHPETLTRSEMDTLPTGRYMQSIGSYVPGAHLNLPDIGGVATDRAELHYPARSRRDAGCLYVGRLAGQHRLWGWRDPAIYRQ